jgi:hypothetical protein
VADVGEQLELFFRRQDGGDEVEGRFDGVAGNVGRAAEAPENVRGNDLFERLILQQRVLAFFKEQKREPWNLALRRWGVGDERWCADEVLRIEFALPWEGAAQESDVGDGFGKSAVAVPRRKDTTNLSG